MPNALRRIVALATCVLLSAAAFARADSSERPSLDPDFPVRIEDAHPVEFKGAYLKLVGRYARDADGTDLTLIQPEIAYGFAPDFDVHLSSTTLIGDGDRSGSGDLDLNAQWLFLDEQQGRWWPAMAVELGVTFPTGVGSDGLDLTAQLGVSKTLAWAPTWDSVHLNLTVVHNFVPAADERDEAYDVILGYSRRVLDDTTFVADVVWERTTADHASSQAVEAGLIQEIGEHVKLAAGLGISLGDDAPDFTATVGVIVEK